MELLNWTIPSVLQVHFDAHLGHALVHSVMPTLLLKVSLGRGMELLR